MVLPLSSCGLVASALSTVRGTSFLDVDVDRCFDAVLSAQLVDQAALLSHDVCLFGISFVERAYLLGEALDLSGECLFTSEGQGRSASSCTDTRLNFRDKGSSDQNSLVNCIPVAMLVETVAG